MNYEHLYAYLDTRPLHEIKACMFNVVNLVRKHSDEISVSDIGSASDEEERVIITANQTKSATRRSRISQRIWTHQAVWNKFGSRSKEFASPAEQSEAVSDLMVLPKVVEYVMSINNSIDGEVNKKPLSRKDIAPKKLAKVSVTPYSTGTCNSRDETAEDDVASMMAPKRLRTSTTPVAFKPCNDDHSVGFSHASYGSRTEWWVDGSSNIVNDTPGTSTSSTGQTDTPQGTKRPYESHQTRSRIVWTKEMDDALTVAQQDKSQGWKVVAQKVGHNVTKHQCVDRWSRVLAPALEGQKKGTLDWADAEVRLLQELVSQHTLPATWNHRQNCLGEERTDWTAIGAILGRMPSFCCSKYRSIVHSKMKRGPFTLAEDALIERRVAEWGNKGMGLWSTLEKEMNRNNQSILSRWKSLTSRKT